MIGINNLFGGIMKVYIASEGFLDENIDQLKEFYTGKNYEVVVVNSFGSLLPYAKDDNLLIASEINGSNHQYKLNQCQKVGPQFKYIIYRDGSPSGRSLTTMFKKAQNHVNEKKVNAVLRHPFDLSAHKKSLEELLE
jgi:hypothetical protein